MQIKVPEFFFSNLEGIPYFFSKATECRKVLEKHIQGSLPRGSSTRWNFYNRTVTKVKQYLEPIKACFEEIRTENRNSKVVRKAEGFLSFLKGSNVKFWLTLFEKVLYHTDILMKTMQKPSITPSSIQITIKNFKVNMQKLRNSDLTCHSSQSIQAEAKEVVDNVISSCEDRFHFTDHLVIAKLFDKDFFQDRTESEFKDILLRVGENYPEIDHRQLKSELEFYYESPDMQKEKLITLTNTFSDSFTDLKKLVEVLITIPMTTTEPERKFSTLSRIKTNLRSTMKNQRLNALGILSMEKKLVRNPEVKLTEKVIQHFINKKNRRIDFVYKRIPL